MATFVAKIVSKSGTQHLDVEAANEAAARRAVAGQGRVMSVTRRRKIGFERGLSPDERIIFFQRLSTMLASRVGTGEALRLMATTFSGRIRTVSSNLLRLVESGLDIGDAMGQAGHKDFPAATTALVQAASHGGEAWRALQDAAEFEQEMIHIKKTSGKGMWGAIGGFLIAIALTLGSTQYIGPKVMASDLIASQSDATSMDLVYAFADAVTWIMGIILVVFLLLLWLGTLGRQIMPQFADNIILRIPGYKDLILSRNNYITFYGLSVLIRSGVRVEEALRLSRDSAPKGALKADLTRAHRAVQTGQPWAMSMKTLHATDKASLATSQDREQVARSLDVLSKQYRQLYAQRIASFVPAMQLLAALFLSIAGLILFGMSILPMLQVAQEMF